ncbi:MAG: hypothetical protein QOK17_1484 [Sphingomonadales bacterium]|jgi:hypothetical protein|nr:hypothetical protein [Sphingomonadales bacterium]
MWIVALAVPLAVFIWAVVLAAKGRVAQAVPLLVVAGVVFWGLLLVFARGGE